MKQKDTLSKVARMADLLDYQNDAVVSRTLVRTEAGSVTLFAFDGSQELSEHTVPHDALVYLLDGEAEIKIAGKLHILREGEMVVMPANRPHAVKAARRFKMFLTMLKS